MQMPASFLWPCVPPLDYFPYNSQHDLSQSESCHALLKTLRWLPQLRIKSRTLRMAKVLPHLDSSSFPHHTAHLLHALEQSLAHTLQVPGAPVPRTFLCTPAFHSPQPPLPPPQQGFLIIYSLSFVRLKTQGWLTQ